MFAFLATFWIHLDTYHLSILYNFDYKTSKKPFYSNNLNVDVFGKNKFENEIFFFQIMPQNPF